MEKRRTRRNRNCNLFFQYLSQTEEKLKVQPRTMVTNQIEKATTANNNLFNLKQIIISLIINL
jgi:uncharacterized protein Smg (DUF494 family)